MSEVDFVRQTGDGPYALTIQLPNDNANPDWHLNGQTVAIDCQVRDTIRTLKEKLAATHLGNMPPSKQQLRSPTIGFLKDPLSLAHFNIPSGATLDLVVRSRGRR